ncbi:hypothetical protein BJ508DRAFT_323534 [Ascobolus immersus RN42]|uniref:Uncharacterized protein n=1 Tax=Ascobolus immersus RN42 TaxID=1160509 RepID=A0A3N4IIT6_ASCIM|nr:hypothetical protein BJ508DRAFT_323534 [Ascobolus immersus RN42]
MATVLSIPTVLPSTFTLLCNRLNQLNEQITDLTHQMSPLWLDKPLAERQTIMSLEASGMPGGWDSVISQFRRDIDLMEQVELLEERISTLEESLTFNEWLRWKYDQMWENIRRYPASADENQRAVCERRHRVNQQRQYEIAAALAESEALSSLSVSSDSSDSFVLRNAREMLAWSGGEHNGQEEERDEEFSSSSEEDSSEGEAASIDDQLSIYQPD